MVDVVAESVLVEPETPIMRLFHQWEALLAETEVAWEAVKDQGVAAEDAVYEATAPDRRRLEEALTAETPTDLRDLAAKVVVLSGEGCFSLPDTTTLECASIVGRDFDKPPRCLFKGDASAAGPGWPRRSPARPGGGCSAAAGKEASSCPPPQ